MENEQEGVSSVSPAEAQDNQVVQEAVTDNATPAVAAEPVKAEQTIPYDRFKQIEEDNKYWRSKYEQMAEMALRNQQPVQNQPVKAAEDDLYAGMDPETERAYRQLDNRMKRLVEKQADELAKQKLEPVLRQTQLLMEHFSQMQLKDFRSENPDVAPGSPEEAKIVQFLNMGMPKNEAVWAVMGPKRAEEKARLGKQVEKAKVEQKVAANLETQAVPKRNGLPEQKKLSFRDELAKAFQAAG